MPVIGRILDARYRILRKIGEGGMGVVYEAEHVGLGKRVAVKVLLSKYAENPEILERFKREARAACRIGHPNIVDVSDIGMSAEREPYMVMELLSGESLADLLKREVKLPLKRTLGIVSQALSALAMAHDAGIVHRDMKPDNLFLSSAGGRHDFVKILDFGVSKFLAGSLAEAKLTQTGSVLGTPYYLAPEQARGQRDVDHRADLYAVGVMTYQMLSGRFPYEAANYHELIFKIGTEDPAPLKEFAPDLPDSVIRLVQSALSKDRNDRPPDARAFQYAISIATGLDSRIPPPALLGDLDDEEDGPRPRPSRFRKPKEKEIKDTSETPTLWTQTVRRRRRIAISAAVGATIILVAIAFLFFGSGDPNKTVVVPLSAPPISESSKAVAAPGRIEPVKKTADTPKPSSPVMSPSPASSKHDDKPRPALAEPALPRLVRVTLLGLPDGAEVTVDGVTHSERPVSLTSGKKPVTFQAKANGYYTSSASVVPDRDRQVEIKMWKKRSGRSRSSDEPAAAPKPAPEKTPSSKPAVIKGKGDTKVKMDYDE